MKAIINAAIYDYQDYRQDSYVLFDADRPIIGVGPMAEFEQVRPQVTETVDAAGCLVLPGLIIGHAHLYSAFVRGLRLPFAPQTFTQLLQQLWWKMDAELDLEATYHSAMVYGAEHIRNGVTTIFDHHASGRAIRGTLAQLKTGFTDQCGLRAMYCFETSDRFNVEECIAENAEFAAAYPGTDGFCRGLFGMHASLSLSQDTLAKVAAAQNGVPLHVHTGESLEDEVNCLNDYGCRIVERWDSFGLLVPDSILAHCVNIDWAEAELAAARGCVAALNPTSNMNTAVGLPDYMLLKECGLPMMIGNDSLGSHIVRCWQNMLYTAHYRSHSSWQVGYDDVLACIRQAYDYASRMLGVRLGRVAPGYEADMLITPFRPATPVSEENAFGQIFDGAFNCFHPRDVFVAGQARMRHYELAMDEAKIYADAAQCAKIYWQRIGGQ